jgi:hypothetical protein
MAESHIVFELSVNSFGVYELKPDNVTDTKGVIKFRSDNEKEQKEQIVTLLNELNLGSYDFYSLAWISSQSVFVPSTVHKASDLSTIFSTCFNKEATLSNLDYNSIGEIGVINVFEIPLWVKSFFVIKYPRIIIQHAFSNILRQSIEKSKTGLEITIVLYQNYFLLELVYDSKFLFANTFEYSNCDDLLYFIAFTIQQSDILTLKGKLLFHFSQEARELKFSEFSEKWSKIESFKEIKCMEQTVPSLPKFHLSCV